HRELASAPLGDAVEPVARQARFGVDDRLALSDDAVEQRRFADVRAADDGHDGPAHIRIRRESATDPARQSTAPAVNVALGLTKVHNTPARLLEARSPTPLMPLRIPKAVPSRRSSTSELVRDDSTEATTGFCAPTSSASSASAIQPWPISRPRKPS